MVESAKGGDGYVPQVPNISDDLVDPEAIRNPYPHLRALREADPVHYNERWKGWVLTSYQGIAEILKLRALSNDKYTPFARMKTPTEDQEAVFRWLALWLGSQDPPLHTRLRGSIQKAFTRRASIDALEPMIRETTTALLDDAQSVGRVDLIADFAYPLTSTVIARQLGMPYADLHRVQAWADAVAPIMFMTMGAKDRYRHAREQLDDMAGYFRALLERRRSEPRDDLVSALATVMAEGGLTEDEVLATCMVVIFGGHETTKDLLGNGTLALLENPDQLERLRAHPELIEPAIEELLRYESPAKSTVRWATEDVQIEGRTIEAGQRILLFWAAANRDPARFPDPDRLDIGRADNAHFGFGWGIHYCIGAPLARREAAIALSMLFDRFGRMELEVPADQLEWSPTIIMRGLTALPIRVSP